MAGVGVVRVRRADNSGSYAYGSIEHDQVQRAFDAYNMAGQLSINQAPEQTMQEADLSFQEAFTGVDMALVQPDPHQVNDSTQRAYEQDCISVRSRPGYARSVFPSETTTDMLTGLRDNAVGSVYYKEGANELSQSGDFTTVTEALAISRANATANGADVNEAYTEVVDPKMRPDQPPPQWGKLSKFESRLPMNQLRCPMEQERDRNGKLWVLGATGAFPMAVGGPDPQGNSLGGMDSAAAAELARVNAGIKMPLTHYEKEMLPRQRGDEMQSNRPQVASGRGTGPGSYGEAAQASEFYATGRGGMQTGGGNFAGQYQVRNQYGP